MTARPPPEPLRGTQTPGRPARTVALELGGVDGPKSQGAAAAQSRRPQGRRGGGTSPPRCGVSTVVAGGTRSTGETGAAGTAPRLPSRCRALCMSLPQTWRNTAASVALLSMVALLTPCVSHRPCHTVRTRTLAGSPTVCQARPSFNSDLPPSWRSSSKHLVRSSPPPARAERRDSAGDVAKEEEVAMGTACVSRDVLEASRGGRHQLVIFL